MDTNIQGFPRVALADLSPFDLAWLMDAPLCCPIDGGHGDGLVLAKPSPTALQLSCPTCGWHTDTVPAGWNTPRT